MGRLDSVIDARNAVLNQENENKKRVLASKVSFDDIQLDTGLIVVDDELDTGNVIYVYAAEKAITLKYEEKLKEIAHLTIHHVNESDMENSIEIHRLGVYSGYRRKGIATKMIERVVELAQIHGVSEIFSLC